MGNARFYCFTALLILVSLVLLWYSEIDIRWKSVKPTIDSGKLFTRNSPPNPKFAITMNTESCLRDHQRKYFGYFATSCDCQVFMVSYKTPCNDSSPLDHVHYFHDKVSFSSERNIGFYEPQKTKHNFLHYIFLDDDVQLVFNKYTPKEMKNKGSPLNVFTRLLLEYEPAGAAVNFHDLYARTIKKWAHSATILRCRNF